MILCNIDKNGYFLAAIEVPEGSRIPPFYVVANPPEGEGYFQWAFGSWIPTDIPPPEIESEPEPEPEFKPIRISRLDFRRLLLPQEAAIFRILENAPKVTQQEIAQAFDPENPDFGIQLRVAVEDAIQQWNLLDQGVIEINHPDTRQFLDVMAMAGMFGSDPVAAQSRIEQIINRISPV